MSVHYGIRRLLNEHLYLGRHAPPMDTGQWYLNFLLNIRGGAEDTRLEAKNTKKIRGQGQRQQLRGQTRVENID